MALTSVTEISLELLTGTPEGERSYLATYEAISDDPGDGPLTVTTDPLLPSFQDSLSFGNDFDDGAFPVNFAAKHKNVTQSRLVWRVFITFSTHYTRRHQDYEDDPNDNNVLISFGGVRFSRVTSVDKNGDGILNTAGGLITDVEMDDYRFTLRIQKNFPSVDLDSYRQFTNRTNSQTFFGLGPRKWKMAAPRGEMRFRGNEDTPYYAITFEFETSSEPDHDTWDRRLIDRGLFEIDTQGNESRITDEKGRPYSTPQLLDGFGGKQTPGGGTVPIAPDFELYDDFDFALLDIPTDFPA